MEIEEEKIQQDKRIVNVLVLGHKAAGKTSAIKHISGLMKDKTRYSYPTTDENNDQGVEGEQFGVFSYETETSRYRFLEYPSHGRYEFKLMSKAKRANIAAIFVSGRNCDLPDHLKAEVTHDLVYLVKSLGISKILVVFSKIDDKETTEKSFSTVRTNFSAFLKDNRFKAKKDFECIPVAFKSDVNIQIPETQNRWWNRYRCFFDALDALELPPIRSESPPMGSLFTNTMVEIDLELDEHPADPAIWCKRAFFSNFRNLSSAFFQAMDKAFNYGFAFKSALHFEPEEIYKCKGVQKIIEGYQYRVSGDVKSAAECYECACTLLDGQNNKRFRQILRKMVSVLQEGEKYDDEKKEICMASLDEEKKVEQERVDNNPSSKTEPDGNEEAAELMNAAELDEANKGEDIAKAPSMIEASCHSEYVLEFYKRSCIYDGHKVIGGISLQISQSFIPCSQLQLENYKELLALGLDETKILTIGDIVNFPTLGNCFAVQPVKPIEICFSSDLSSSSQEWVLHIWRKLKKVYREAVDGIRYLHSKGYVCGNLDGVVTSLYVTSNEEVRILPAMDSNMDSDVGSAADINDFLRGIKKILKISPHETSICSQGFPMDLNHFLTFVTSDKLNHVPSFWLLNHFLFWTAQERVDFILNLNNLIKMNQLMFFNDELDGVIVECEWYNRIPSGGVLEKIWSKGDPQQLGWLAVSPNWSPSDLLRYMYAVYHHYNDNEYASVRPKILNMVEIESILYTTFPKIYEQLTEALYRCAEKGYVELENLKTLSHYWY